MEWAHEPCGLHHASCPEATKIGINGFGRIGRMVFQVFRWKNRCGGEAEPSGHGDTYTKFILETPMKIDENYRGTPHFRKPPCVLR